MDSRLARYGSALRIGTLGPLFALALGACGSDDGTLKPPPPGQGTQLEMTSMLAPGQEIERCRFFVAPAEGLYIRRDEVRYTPGSHHVLLYRTPYKSIPTQDFRGQARDTSGVFDCPDGAGAYFQITGVIGGAQSARGDSMVDLPAGVAVYIPGGSVLLMNTHYLNASPSPVETSARINLYTIPKEQMKQEAGVLFFYNPFIRVPSLGAASARMRCPISRDITLVNAQSHMHARGMNYVADFLPAGGTSGERLYEGTEWENVAVKHFGDGKPLAAGSAIDYRCDYRNRESREVTQGPSAHDEMCMFIGAYYPRQPELEGCFDPTYIGTGTRSCGESLACVQQGGGDFRAHNACMVESCAAVAPQLTAAYQCMGRAWGGACRTDCQADSTKCQTCLQAACGAEFSACQAARCP